MSAASVSRIGLPLSHVSATANFSRFCSRRSAILRSKFERVVGEDLFHCSLALCAASSASSMSSTDERGTFVKTLPSTGEIFSKYSPFTGATHSPPIKLSYCALNSTLEPDWLGST